MEHKDIWRAWGRILQGYRPFLSIEITKRCPLSCPGCYAYQPNHVNGIPLEEIGEYTDVDLIDRVLELVDEHRPLAVYLVGGEPLVRHRELSILLPELLRRRVKVEVVTSAVRPIPAEWRRLDNLSIVVSVDGLQPEHDARRRPATYDRILAHIAGHKIIVHCTVTAQMTRRPGYLEEFFDFWSRRLEVTSIRISLFTPQQGESSAEILAPTQRRRVIDELSRLRPLYPKVRLTSRMLDAYREPPGNPDNCIFSKVTHCISSDLESPISPCQFGGTPDCTQCGCVATVGLDALGRTTLGGIRLRNILSVSSWVGAAMDRLRRAANGPSGPTG
ncbi:MAG TPA: radical SAM protein [Acidobacteriota bacterium]|nr:radical SAM protein [Acidobacteriota bacterium]